MEFVKYWLKCSLIVLVFLLGVLSVVGLVCIFKSIPSTFEFSLILSFGIGLLMAIGKDDVAN